MHLPGAAECVVSSCVFVNINIIMPEARGDILMAMQSPTTGHLHHQHFRHPPLLHEYHLPGGYHS
jgi:hypothetical protein